MRVLGRGLVDPFDEFWSAFSPEIPIPEDVIERGLGVVFGDQGMETAGPVPRWMSLPDDDLAYHVAHELAHILLRARGYPKTMRGVGYPPDSAEARVGEDLEEMVLHPSLERVLAPFGFRRDFMLGVIASNAMAGLSSAPVPEYGSPWHFTWAIRFCMLQMELPPDAWSGLEALYFERAPTAASLGQELFDIMVSVGWGSRGRALEAMVRTRDALGLDVQDKILVLDPTTGRIS